MLDHVDLFSEKHMVVYVGDSWPDDGMPYTYVRDDDYTSLIKHWIEQACSGARLPLDDFDIYFHLQELTSVCSHIVTKIPMYDYTMLDVALIWFVAKHKGRFHVIDEMIQWLHWLFDFT